MQNYMISGNSPGRKIATIIMAIFLMGFPPLYADEQRSDAEKIIGVWIVEAPYGSGKMHHEYEFSGDGTFRYDKWYLNKKGVPENKAGTLNKRIDVSGKYSFEKNERGRSIFVVRHIFNKRVEIKVIYKHEFIDDNTLKTASHRGKHKRVWKKKDGHFEWR